MNNRVLALIECVRRISICPVTANDWHRSADRSSAVFVRVEDQERILAAQFIEHLGKPVPHAQPIRTLGLVTCH